MIGPSVVLLYMLRCDPRLLSRPCGKARVQGLNIISMLVAVYFGNDVGAVMRFNVNVEELDGNLEKSSIRKALFPEGD